jgi:hypothetical protein
VHPIVRALVRRTDRMPRRPFGFHAKSAIQQPRTSIDYPPGEFSIDDLDLIQLIQVRPERRR